MPFSSFLCSLSIGLVLGNHLADSFLWRDYEDVVALLALLLLIHVTASSPWSSQLACALFLTLILLKVVDKKSFSCFAWIRSMVVVLVICFAGALAGPRPPMLSGISPIVVMGHTGPRFGAPRIGFLRSDFGDLNPSLKFIIIMWGSMAAFINILLGTELSSR